MYQYRDLSSKNRSEAHTIYTLLWPLSSISKHTSGHTYSGLNSYGVGLLVAKQKEVTNEKEIRHRGRYFFGTRWRYGRRQLPSQEP